MEEQIIGIITKINGPIIDAKNMRSSTMLEVVAVGNERLIGEVIRLNGDIATLQVYEPTYGLKPGDPVYCSGMPLSVSLGPGLIGNIYDGIQRPLRDIKEASGAYIKRGEKTLPLNIEKKWHFKPLLKEGDIVNQGMIFGIVEETTLIKHFLMIPPDIAGVLIMLKPEGDYTIEELIALVETEATKREKSKIHNLKMYHRWPARVRRPYKQKLDMTIPLITGQRVIDTFFPIAKGGTAAIPGGFGTGKTMTQHALAKWSDADIIVYVGCGERGNEMTDVLSEFPKLVDPRSGRPLMERTIMIANTSNMPVAAREVSIYTGITMAEYYRDMGYHVAIMADSTSRWAEALRELSGRLEEMPADEGFPAYLPSRLASFYERAGMVETLNNKEGSVSIIGAVSPPGGDFSEPVTQHTRRFIRCFWALDRLLANARHYPAISWLNSYSEYIQDLIPWWENVDMDWTKLRDEAMEILIKEDKLQQIVKLVGPDALPDIQRLVLFIAELIKNSFLQQNAFDKVDMYSTPQKQIWMLRILLQLYNKGQGILRLGATIHILKELPIIEEIIRMKFNIPNEKPKLLEELSQRLEQVLEGLERNYR